MMQRGIKGKWQAGHVHCCCIRSCGPSPAKTNAQALKVGAVSGPSRVRITQREENCKDQPKQGMCVFRLQSTQSRSIFKKLFVLLAP